MLIQFRRDLESLCPKDCGEKIADIFLKPLRLSCGRCVKVDQEFNVIHEETISKATRVFTLFLTAVLFPVTVPLIVIGMLLAACSNSYQKVAQIFVNNEKTYIVPARRYPPIGPIDTNRKHAQVINIADKDIIQIHPMRFLPNRFLNKEGEASTIGGKCVLNKETNGLAITKTGKHVILQQAYRSCVPTAIGMIVLDHQGNPNYRAMEETCLANSEQAIGWVREAGFEPRMTHLQAAGNKARVLADLLQQNGPGVLSINCDVGCHVVVLDAISLQDQTAAIRDPYHGWAITIKLNVLESYLAKHSNCFLQIQK